MSMSNIVGVSKLRGLIKPQGPDSAAGLGKGHPGEAASCWKKGELPEDLQAKEFSLFSWEPPKVCSPGSVVGSKIRPKITTQLYLVKEGLLGWLLQCHPQVTQNCQPLQGQLASRGHSSSSQHPISMHESIQRPSHFSPTLDITVCYTGLKLPKGSLRLIRGFSFSLCTFPLSPSTLNPLCQALTPLILYKPDTCSTPTQTLSSGNPAETLELI